MKQLNKKKIVLISAITAFLALVLMTTFSILAAETPTLSEVAIDKAYPLNTMLEIPKANFTLKDEQKDAQTIIHMPDGSAFNYDRLELSQTGQYTLEYSAYFNGRRHSKSFTFEVYTQTYTIKNSNAGSATYYNDYKFKEFDGSESLLSGILVDLPAGGEFVFNKIIDFSDKAAQDAFVKFAILPQDIGTIDASYLYFVLTDAHDSNNYITVSFHDMEYSAVRYGQKDNYDNLKKYWYSFTTSYAKAGSNLQTLAGLNAGKADTSANYGTMCGPSFHGVTTIDYNTGLSKDFFAEKAFRTIALDYNTKEIYVGNRLVIDLDNADYFSEFWNGFTTGEAYLSVYFGNYAGSNSARLFISDIDGTDLSDTSLYDDGAPEISVEEPEEGIYKGVVGYPYSVFDAVGMDSYDGELPVKASVYYNYYSNYRQLINIEEGKFIPDREGFYSMVYVAKDSSGNETTKIITTHVIEEKEKIQIKIEKPEKEVVVGGNVSIATPLVENAFGKQIIDVKVTCGKEKYEVADWKFLPKEVGTYDIKYKVEDSLGRTATTEYQLKVKKSEKPIFYEKPTLPKYLMSGKEYTLSELQAIGYSKSNKGVVLNAKTYITDKDGRREIKNGRFSPNIGVSGQKVTIEYVATEGNVSNVMKYEIPCYIVTDGKKIDITGYFVNDSGVSVEAFADKVKAKTSSNKKGFEFVNALITNDMNIELTIDKTASAFGKLHVFFEDSINPDIQVKLTLAKKENASAISLNDSAVAYGLKFSYSNENTPLMIELNKTGTVFSFGNENKTISIDKTLAGENFTGFPSGKVYVRFVFDEVTGPSALNITKINDQPIRVLTSDRIAPKLSICGEYMTSYEKGTKVTLFKAFAGDVLEPEVKTFVMSVRGPKGDVIVKETDLLNSENAEKEITINLKEYGSYSLSYTATDASGRRLSWSQNLNVRDDIAPVIKVEKKLPTTATSGKKVTIPKATAEDNLDGEVPVYIFVEDTEGAIQLIVGSGRQEFYFNPKMAGEYLVKYVSFDKTNNMSIETYSIVVK